MACDKCSYEGESEFFKEDFKCKCGEINSITYHICKQCGWMWRELNGELSEGSQVHFDQLKEFTDVVDNPAAYSEEDKKIMDNLQKEIERIARVEEGNTKTMSDYVHKCLRCETPAAEIEPGIFHCPACDFEWEVLRFE